MTIWNEIALFGMKLTYFELKLIKIMFQECPYEECPSP